MVLSVMECQFYCTEARECLKIMPAKKDHLKKKLSPRSAGFGFKLELLNSSNKNGHIFLKGNFRH